MYCIYTEANARAPYAVQPSMLIVLHIHQATALNASLNELNEGGLSLSHSLLISLAIFFSLRIAFIQTYYDRN